jgi:outer membrane immunogenic protein
VIRLPQPSKFTDILYSRYVPRTHTSVSYFSVVSFGGPLVRRLTLAVMAAASCIALAQIASAADLPVKGPPAPAPTPVYNWTGWYAGVNLGARFGHVETDFNADPVTVVRGVGPSSFTTPGLAGSDVVHPSGFIGGGQIGYNWQFSPAWVAGLEADFQGAVEKNSNTTLISSFSGTSTGVGFPVSGSTVLNYQTSVEWFGTVRGRIGYVWGDGDVMSYVTGGLAYGKVGFAGATSTVSGIVGGTSFSLTNAISGQSHVNAGWVVGFGTEGKTLIPGLTYKIESLYVDLGTLDGTDVVVGVPVFGGLGFTGATGGQTITRTHFTNSILRVGLNYRFH